MNKIFLVQIIIITFIYLLALFNVQNFKKFLQRIQSYEDAPFFGLKTVHFPKQFFFLKTIIIILIYLLNPFIEQNFKKPVNEPFFFIHAYLRVKNQSQILVY